MKVCSRCQLEYGDDAKFCTACGTLLEIKPEAPEVSPFLIPRGDEIGITIWGKIKKSPLQALGIAAGLTILGLLIIASTATPGTPLNPAPRKLTAAFSASSLKAATPDCTIVVESVRNGVDFSNARKLLAKTSAISDGRKAASAITTTWHSTALSLASKYKDAVQATYMTSYQSLVHKSKDATSEEKDSWAEQWRNYVLKSCGATEAFEANSSTLTNLHDAAESLTVLAASVPWYPEGYYESSEGIAWKWSNGGGCQISSWGCWHMNVISKDGCPSGVYAAINILDSAGTVVGYTNDSLPGLAPMQKARLEFANTTDYNTAQFQELKCY